MLEDPGLEASLHRIKECLDTIAFGRLVGDLTRVSRQFQSDLLELEKAYNTNTARFSYFRRIRARRGFLESAVLDIERLIKEYANERVKVEQYHNYIYSPHFAGGVSRLVPEILCRFPGVVEPELARIILERNTREAVVRLIGRAPRRWRAGRRFRSTSDPEGD